MSNGKLLAHPFISVYLFEHMQMHIVPLISFREEDQHAPRYQITKLYFEVKGTTSDNIAETSSEFPDK